MPHKRGVLHETDTEPYHIIDSDSEHRRGNGCDRVRGGCKRKRKGIRLFRLFDIVYGNKRMVGTPERGGQADQYGRGKPVRLGTEI